MNFEFDNDLCLEIDGEKEPIVLQLGLRWWIHIYIHCLIMFCRFFDLEPNWDRVEQWIARGIYFKKKE